MYTGMKTQTPLPEAKMSAPFILSIEPTGKPAYVHGFHLGTDEAVARKIAEEMFRSRRYTCTVALIRDHKLVDVYDGAWASESTFWSEE